MAEISLCMIVRDERETLGPLFGQRKGGGG